MKFKAACVQLNCQDNPQQNFQQAEIIIKDAAKDGADFILTPEHTDIIVKDKKDYFKYAQKEEESQILAEYKNLAAKLGKWIVVGSMAIKVDYSKKLVNRSFLIDNNGKVVNSYDKMHQFDVDLEEDKTVYSESDNFIPGEFASVTKTPYCNLGMTVCYDLRFSTLYHKLALAGANFITIPAAFTHVTGKAHWHILVRARAIETGCFVIAAGQTGIHPAGNRSYGHSLIVDPWGVILAQTQEETGFISANIDMSISEKVRKQIPNLKHSRDIKVVS